MYYLQIVSQLQIEVVNMYDNHYKMFTNLKTMHRYNAPGQEKKHRHSATRFANVPITHRNGFILVFRNIIFTLVFLVFLVDP